MRFSSVLASCVALSGLAVAAPASSGSKGDSLYKAMRQRGRTFIGTALTLRNETAEPKIIKQDFNSITPENAQKWESTEPSRGNFTFADADRHVAFAKQNGLQIHCHTLVWHSQLPAWVSEGGFDNATLIQVMEDHIKALAGRYKGACTRWDVVNEALNEDGTYRESVWYNTIGEAYLPIAFKLAAKYDSHAKLFYNDYNLEYNNAKTEGTKRIVKLIKSYGVKIDGVGYQAHLSSEVTATSAGPTPNQTVLEQAFRTTSALGVDVAYTEIDIRMNTPATPEKLEVQAQAYQRVAAACLAVKRCVGMTVWGISDKYSWIPGVFEGEGAANIWDEHYWKKPAYQGFLKGIVGR
ncbi:endo-1,4-beta-xylanase-like protein [Byssothecium circinans]|uniref:Beta-xylanase n=1 Tax=Byssothecium circinans TaxID=147558 RepID=A0A6A5TMN0_9PLEO|nr:endo-1,4-beta-xylanase-like protein [Byssothecium circinans]